MSMETELQPALHYPWPFAAIMDIIILHTESRKLYQLAQEVVGTQTSCGRQQVTLEEEISIL